MPDRELESVIWCARCGTDKFEVWRVPIDDNGHYGHATVPESIPSPDRTHCRCGAVLERKP